MNKTLEVIGKPLSYATRRMLPGDIFEAPARDARLLAALNRVREPRALVDLPPPPPELVAQDLARLRAEYQRVVGKKPYHGWDVATLRAKMA